MLSKQKEYKWLFFLLTKLPNGDLFRFSGQACPGIGGQGNFHRGVPITGSASSAYAGSRASLLHSSRVVIRGRVHMVKCSFLLPFRLSRGGGHWRWHATAVITTSAAVFRTTTIGPVDACGVLNVERERGSRQPHRVKPGVLQSLLRSKSSRGVQHDQLRDEVHSSGRQRLPNVLILLIVRSACCNLLAHEAAISRPRVITRE